MVLEYTGSVAGAKGTEASQPAREAPAEATTGEWNAVATESRVARSPAPSSCAMTCSTAAVSPAITVCSGVL